MDKLISMLKEIGLPYVYSHWAQGEVPNTPYICYMMASNNPFGADGKVYKDFLDIDLELYSDKPDKEAQMKIISVLSKYGIFYTVSETWIPGEGLYQTWFTFEMEA